MKQRVQSVPITARDRMAALRSRDMGASAHDRTASLRTERKD